MPYRVALWDFDGTLADTLGLLLRVYNALADRHGLARIDDPEPLRSLTLWAVLRRHRVSLLRLPALIRQVLAAQRSEMAGVRLFPGIPAVLQALRREGCRQSVLSSNDRANILACLEANAAAEYFDDVLGYRRLLGKGRAIRRWVRGQGVAAGEVVYVGDEVRDIEAARQAGVAVASVTWGFNTRELLADHGPDHLVDRPEQLLDLFR